MDTPGDNREIAREEDNKEMYQNKAMAKLYSGVHEQKRKTEASLT